MEEYRLHFGLHLKLGTIKSYARDVIQMIDLLFKKGTFNVKEAEALGYRLEDMMKEYGKFLQTETHVSESWLASKKEIENDET